MADLLDSDRIAAALDGLDGWEAADDALHRTWAFEGYRGAVAFVMRVALEAERANHHPDLTLSWGEVTIRLTSHDAGGVTSRDLDLARIIEDLPR
jgi:4a-hydroxytetrahydrobiopterin dehydratase